MINGLLEIARKLLDVADVILEDTNDDDDPIYLKKADTDKYEKKNFVKPKYIIPRPTPQKMGFWWLTTRQEQHYWNGVTRAWNTPNDILVINYL